MYVSPTNGGHVEVNGVSLRHADSFTPLVPYTNTILRAIPAFGYRFVGWSGDIDKKTDVVIINAADDTMVTANFSRVMPLWLLFVVIAVGVFAGIFAYRRRRIGSRIASVVAFGPDGKTPTTEEDR